MYIEINVKFTLYKVIILNIFLGSGLIPEKSFLILVFAVRFHLNIKYNEIII